MPKTVLCTKLKPLLSGCCINKARVMPGTNYRSEIVLLSTYGGSVHLTFLLVSPVVGTRQGASCRQSCARVAQGTADDTEKEAPFSVLAQIL